MGERGSSSDMSVEGPPANQQARGAVFGLCAAALFGLSAPAAKLLLGGTSPTMLAGLLYLGAAAGLWLHRAVAPPTQEAGLKRQDVVTLAGVVLAGGVAGPVCMLFGLSRVSGLTGSLLLNLEAPFTVLLAVLLFREHLGRQALAATILICGGATLLEVQPGPMRSDPSGVLLLAAACGCWALDNNLTQRLSLRDPFAIVRIKTLGAGIVNTALALLVVDSPLPVPTYLVAALVVGSLGYGVSVVLDAYALRLIGAAREAAYFATAPFVGALGSVAFLGDELRWRHALAMVAMSLGVALLLRERHSHRHEHGALEHEHMHHHDEHHRHRHHPTDPPGEPHTHAHRHAPLVHDHPHVPDAHHRHRH
jgi:drug/metabolite transporter (DMT)-like permease